MDQDLNPPFEVVPATRPIIMIGPSLKGYQVTDLIHKALYHFLKNKFKDRLVIYKSQTDLTLARKNMMTIPRSDKDIFQGARAVRMKAEVQHEVERIYEKARNLQLVLLDCSYINHPAQVMDSSLAPIVVYIKATPKVVEQLVKLRQKKNVGGQIGAAQRLSKCTDDMFDLILDEGQLGEATERLGSYLEQYWKDLHTAEMEDYHLKAPLLEDGNSSVRSSCSSLPSRRRSSHSPSRSRHRRDSEPNLSRHRLRHEALISEEDDMSVRSDSQLHHRRKSCPAPRHRQPENYHRMPNQDFSFEA